jgi:dihydroflavonol-4-reductase
MILVTGATGLVGSHVLLDLLRRGLPVRALIRNKDRISVIRTIFSFYEPDPDRLLAAVEWAYGDILDVGSLVQAITGADQVIHSAAVVSFDRRDKAELFRVNVGGTYNVVNLCLANGVGKLAFVSSVAALGSPEEGRPTDESAWWNDPPGATNYSRSKYLAEMEVWRASEEGLPVVIVNPATIIGPGEWGRGSTALARRVHEGLKVYTEGVTGYVDVRDVAWFTNELLLSSRKDERFLLCAGNLSFRELFSMFARALNKPEPGFKAKPWMLQAAWALDNMRSFFLHRPALISRETARKAFSRVYYDGSKVNEALDRPYIPLEDSIRHTADCLLRSN